MLSKEEEARRQRLRSLRIARKHKSAMAAAKAIGVPDSTYRSYENGQRPLTEPAAMLYAEGFAASYDWLWEGAGEMDKPSRGQPAPNASSRLISPTTSNRLLPVRGRAQGGDGGEVVLDGSVIDHLPGPSSLDEVGDAYGVEVIGDSMVPRYFPREIVWVHPGRGVHGGDFAVFHVRQENGDLHAYVKRYVKHSNGKVIAAQFNPAREVIFDRDDVEEIHLIVAAGIR